MDSDDYEIWKELFSGVSGAIMLWGAYTLYPTGIFSLPFAQLTLGMIFKLILSIVFIVTGPCSPY